jgi:hypothetical protein
MALGADGVHVAKGDQVDGNRSKVMKNETGSHGDHCHPIRRRCRP